MELLERESSGILNWLITGCQMWKEEGLGEAEAVVKATETYRQECDVLAEFIETLCVRGEQPSTNVGFINVLLLS